MGTRKNPFFFLLGGLLVALLVTPVMTEHYPRISGTMLTVTLVISTLSMSAAKRTYKLAWSLVAMKIVLELVRSTTPIPGLFIAECVVLSAFFVVATVFALGRVLEDDYVDLNRIAGAISVYMLLGLIYFSVFCSFSSRSAGFRRHCCTHQLSGRADQHSLSGSSLLQLRNTEHPRLR